MSCANLGGASPRHSAAAATMEATLSSNAPRISSGDSTTVMGRPVATSRPGSRRAAPRRAGGGADGELHRLRRALADRHAVAVAYVVLNGRVEVEAPAAQRLHGHDASQRNDGHLPGAAADVHDHVAHRFVDGQPGPDGGGHRLFDEEAARRAGRRAASLMACRLTAVMAEGTQIKTLGRLSRPTPTRCRSTLSIRSVTSKSVMAPPRSGRSATMYPGVRPIICHASVPMASTSRLRESARDHGRLVQHQALPLGVDQCVGRAEIDGQVRDIGASWYGRPVGRRHFPGLSR